ncbi:MAG: hypothetical protein AAF268_13025 [Cyanobacteria bacterium P01_A01_bin.3]
MTVRFAGTLSEDQFIDFHELCTPAATGNVAKFYSWILIGVGLCSMILLWDIAIDILPPVLIIAGILFWVQWQTRRNIALSWKGSKFLRAHTRREASRSSLVWKNQYLSACYPWNLFFSYKNSSKLAAIFSTKNSAIIIPRAFFSSHDEWGECIDLVAENVTVR